MRKLFRKYAFVPERLVTDDLRSYSAAVRALGSNADMSAGDGRTIGPRIRISQRDGGSARAAVESPASAQKFLSTHAAVYNTFNVQRHLTSAQTHRTLRAAAMETWRTPVAAA